MIALLAAALLVEPPAPGLLAALAAIRDGSRPCADARLVYRDGDDRVGHTLVQVFGRWARVERTEPGEAKQTFRGRVPDALCIRLVRVALDGALWKSRSRRKAAVDDETRPSIQVGVQGAGAFTARMWGFDVQDSAVFAMTRADLLLVARTVSGGAVLY